MATTSPRNEEAEEYTLLDMDDSELESISSPKSSWSQSKVPASMDTVDEMQTLPSTTMEDRSPLPNCTAMAEKPELQSSAPSPSHYDQSMKQAEGANAPLSGHAQVATSSSLSDEIASPHPNNEAQANASHLDKRLNDLQEQIIPLLYCQVSHLPLKDPVHLTCCHQVVDRSAALAGMRDKQACLLCSSPALGMLPIPLVGTLATALSEVVRGLDKSTEVPSANNGLHRNQVGETPQEWRSIQCVACMTSEMTRTQYKQHVSTHVSCIIPGCAYVGSKRFLKGHLARVHGFQASALSPRKRPSTEWKCVRCTACNTKPLTQSGYARHVLEHSRCPDVCCSFEAKPLVLRNHVKMHHHARD